MDPAWRYLFDFQVPKEQYFYVQPSSEYLRWISGKTTGLASVVAQQPYCTPIEFQTLHCVEDYVQKEEEEHSGEEVIEYNRMKLVCPPQFAAEICLFPQIVSLPRHQLYGEPLYDQKLSISQPLRGICDRDKHLHYVPHLVRCRPVSRTHLNDDDVEEMLGIIQVCSERTVIDDLMMLLQFNVLRWFQESTAPPCPDLVFRVIVVLSLPQEFYHRRYQIHGGCIYALERCFLESIPPLFRIDPFPLVTANTVQREIIGTQFKTSGPLPSVWDTMYQFFQRFEYPLHHHPQQHVLTSLREGSHFIPECSEKSMKEVLNMEPQFELQGTKKFPLVFLNLEKGYVFYTSTGIYLSRTLPPLQQPIQAHLSVGMYNPVLTPDIIQVCEVIVQQTFQAASLSCWNQNWKWNGRMVLPIHLVIFNTTQELGVFMYYLEHSEVRTSLPCWPAPFVEVILDPSEETPTLQALCKFCLHSELDLQRLSACRLIVTTRFTIERSNVHYPVESILKFDQLLQLHSSELQHRTAMETRNMSDVLLPLLDPSKEMWSNAFVSGIETISLESALDQRLSFFEDPPFHNPVSRKRKRSSNIAIEVTNTSEGKPNLSSFEEDIVPSQCSFPITFQCVEWKCIFAVYHRSDIYCQMKPKSMRFFEKEYASYANPSLVQLGSFEKYEIPVELSAVALPLKRFPLISLVKIRMNCAYLKDLLHTTHTRIKDLVGVHKDLLRSGHLPVFPPLPSLWAKLWNRLEHVSSWETAVLYILGPSLLHFIPLAVNHVNICSYHQYNRLSTVLFAALNAIKTEAWSVFAGAICTMLQNPDGERNLEPLLLQLLSTLFESPEPLLSPEHLAVFLHNSFAERDMNLPPVHPYLYVRDLIRMWTQELDIFRIVELHRFCCRKCFPRDVEGGSCTICCNYREEVMFQCGHKSCKVCFWTMDETSSCPFCKKDNVFQGAVVYSEERSPLVESLKNRILHHVRTSPRYLVLITLPSAMSSVALYIWIRTFMKAMDPLCPDHILCLEGNSFGEIIAMTPFQIHQLPDSLQNIWVFCNPGAESFQFLTLFATKFPCHDQFVLHVCMMHNRCTRVLTTSNNPYHLLPQVKAIDVFFPKFLKEVHLFTGGPHTSTNISTIGK